MSGPNKVSDKSLTNDLSEEDDPEIHFNEEGANLGSQFFDSLVGVLTDTEEENMSESDKIWEEIKGLKLNVFALPGQTLGKHATMVKTGGEDLHLKLSSSSIIVPLEEALGSKFLIEMADEFVVVKRNS